MKLGHKLILAPVITAAVVLATSQLNVFLSGRAAQATDVRHAHDMDQLQSLSDVQAQVGQMHVEVYRLMTIIGSVDEARTVAVRKAMADQSQGIQRVLQFFHQRGACAGDIGHGAHQAAAPRRSKILPSFSSSVCAVNGLMM